MPEIVVIAESQGLKLLPSTLEACQAASNLSVALGASWGILISDRAANAANGYGSEVISYPLTEDDEQSPDILASTVAEISESAKVIIMAATCTGKDIMGRIAQILSTSLAQDCIGFQSEDSGKILFKRELYGGKILANVELSGSPILVTFRPRSFTPIDRLEQSTPTKFHVKRAVTSQAIVTLKPRSKNERPDVTEASIVVSGGRGLQGPENWHLLEDLTDALGSNATLACSRPVSDEGWRPHNEHVGQTGRSISPDVYIAIGISGATQHIAGIAGSKFILAINKDPEAPIFRIADYGIVGDLFEVVPDLASAIRDAGKII